MTRRIQYTAWSTWARDHELPAYAVADSDGIESDAARVAAAIARRAGLHVVTMRPDCSRLEGGVVVGDQYQITLGRPCPGGGWTPEGEVWIDVPR